MQSSFHFGSPIKPFPFHPFDFHQVRDNSPISVDSKFVSANWRTLSICTSLQISQTIIIQALFPTSFFYSTAYRFHCNLVSRPFYERFLLTMQMVLPKLFMTHSNEFVFAKQAEFTDCTNLAKTGKLYRSYMHRA